MSHETLDLINDKMSMHEGKGQQNGIRHHKRVDFTVMGVETYQFGGIGFSDSELSLRSRRYFEDDLWS